jgi:hypothetical protein
MLFFNNFPHKKYTSTVFICGIAEVYSTRLTFEINIVLTEAEGRLLRALLI